MTEQQSANGPQSAGAPSAERQILEQLARESLIEQRKSRRWGIFFKLFIVAYLLLALLVVQIGEPSHIPSGGEFTAVVELAGPILPENNADADHIVGALRKAFENKGTKGIILRANSPGGSPVQAGYIYDEIVRLRKKHENIPLYTVVVDACASACYYIASASDKIYANKASIVGSIGVLINGFGFVDTLNKLGVERRLLTAGENKGFLDPFSPMNEKAKQHAKELLAEVHQQFITAVRDGRGEALKENDEIFSGLYWTGEKAKEMGLVDDLASASEVARDVIKAEKLVDFTLKENVLDRLAKQFGAAVGQSMTLKLETTLPRIQ